MHERLSVSVRLWPRVKYRPAREPGEPCGTPEKIKVKQDGVVHFLVAGFHQVAVYKPGTRPEDIVVPQSFLQSHRLSTTLTQPILPGDQSGRGAAEYGRRPRRIPSSLVVTPSNAQNRIESVGFPATEGVGTNMVESPKAEPGVYLVICNVRGHFLDGMFAFVKVKAEDEDD